MKPLLSRLSPGSLLSSGLQNVQRLELTALQLFLAMCVHHKFYLDSIIHMAGFSLVQMAQLMMLRTTVRLYSYTGVL